MSVTQMDIHHHQHINLWFQAATNDMLNALEPVFVDENNQMFI